MNGAAASSLPLELASRWRVSFRDRLFAYLGVWTLAALVPLLVPDHGSTLSERLMGALQTPLVALFGLSLAITFPHPPSDLTGVLAVVLLVVHGMASLVQTHRGVFYGLMVAHVVMLLVAVVYLVRFGHLPDS